MRYASVPGVAGRHFERNRDLHTDCAFVSPHGAMLATRTWHDSTDATCRNETAFTALAAKSWPLFAST